MKMSELTATIRVYADQHRGLACIEQADALERLAGVLEKLPKDKSVSAALKKRKT